MREEFAGEIAKGYITLEEIQENSHEWIEGYLPIYNNEIVKEWQEMPSDYDNRGHAELGLGQEIDIINLMSLDLNIYYTDLFNEVMAEMEEGE
jgi:hypothetical protein